MRKENHSAPVRIGNWRIDADGMLRVTAHVLKEGVYPYGADESDTADIIPGVDPVQEYIPLAEFTEDALTSLEGKPVVINAHEWRDVGNTLVDGLTVGTIAGRPTVTDGGCIECDFLIFDPATIEAVTNGELVEVSAGYNARLHVGEGDFAGRPYHGTQTNLEFNHVLLLPPGMGRCGYDVRIINSRGDAPQKDQGARTMSFHTIKVTIGNKKRSFKFTNQEDAEQAENMLNEEQAFNAEKLGEAIAQNSELTSQLESVQAALDANKGELEAAKAQIDKLLDPAAQEALAEEIAAQKEDEEAIVNTEAENSDDEGEDSEAEEEKEAFGNAIKKCKNMAERRAAIVTRAMSKRGVDTKGWNQDAIDGAFRTMAVSARANAKAKAAPARTMNGARTPGQDGTPKSNRDRMLAPMKAANAKPQK